jgi:hypothetical protein
VERRKRLKLHACSADWIRAMKAAVEPAMFVGLGTVAVWLYVRYPSRRPCSLARAAGHVALSFVAFWLLAQLLLLVLPSVPSHALAPWLVLAYLIPTLTYVLLSWIWLIARILHDLLGGPRGGLPAPTGTR